MILPSVHRNGTSLNALASSYERAAVALDEFITEWSDMEFNSRDYYVQGNDAWRDALDQRLEIDTAIRKIRDYLLAHREHLDNCK